MIKQAVRLAIIAGIWKRYKAIIVSSLLFLAYLWLLSFVHGEFLDYSQSVGSKDNIGLSFVLKWLLGLGGLLVFFAYHFWWRGKDKKQTTAAAKNNTAENKKAKVNEKPRPKSSVSSNAPDPFQALRDKPNLRSRGDIELEKSKTKV